MEEEDEDAGRVFTVAVGVMARAPSAPGKTRLAGEFSESRLRRLRISLVADTLQLVTSIPGIDPFVFFTPAEGRDEIVSLADPSVRAVPQHGVDLGARMLHAVRHLVEVERYSAAILVGTDIPLLTAEHVSAAREQLHDRSVVLGPTDDGGYYLIGMSSVCASLFERIEWGSASVLTDTLRAAERNGLDARLISGTYDIDTIDDLNRLERDLEGLPAAVAPNVRRWFLEKNDR